MGPKKNLTEHYEDGKLDLSLSSIQEIPVRDIAAFPKAVHLDLSCNNIISLPKLFAVSLTRLTVLDLSQNQIASLPENFGLLVNLKHLDLDNNKLESLPLSFGNLKSLRWLDLKRNPLMPKLAQIAGLCLDAQQCHAAARNVVAALHSMQEQVNAEIERRKEKQSKKMEKLEEEQKKAKENQQPKKKKKKSGNTPGNHDNPSSLNGQIDLSHKEESENLFSSKEEDSPVPSKQTAQNNGFLKKVGSILKLTVKCIVMSTLLVVFCAFLLSLFDEDLYMSLRKKVNDQIQSNVPKHYLKHWDNGVLSTQRTVTKWSKQLITIGSDWLNKGQDYIVAISSDELVQQYLESIKSGWHIVWIWFNEKYTAISAELPHYFSSVQSAVVDSSTKQS